MNDANGDIAVVDRGGVDLFEPTVLGYTFLRRLTATPSGPLSGLGSVAIDSGEGEHNGDIYVATGGCCEPQAVDQFSASGEYVGHIIETPEGPFGQAESVAVDPASHDVYVGNRGGFVALFGPSILVPDVTTGPVTNLKARSATFTGTVNPHKGGDATCQVEYGTSSAFGEAAPCSAAVAEGESPATVQAPVSGLVADTTYHYRLQASNANGTNPGEALQDQEFTTPGPGIHDQSASTVTAVSATLNATINPNGASTTYYFQYGTSTSYESSVPAPPGVSLGSGEGDLSVTVHVQGLAPGTTYHYRVVAIGEPGEEVKVEGTDHTFTTQAAGTELSQPDGRAWELVTPPNKQGAGIIAQGNEQGDDIQAAQNGGAITYGVTAPLTNNAAGASSPEVTQSLSTREAPGIWGTRDITPPHSTGAWQLAIGHSAEYKLFSSDLSLGLVEPADASPLPPLPSNAEKTVYLRHNGECEPTPSEPVPATCYQALATKENIAEGAKIEGYGPNGDGDIGIVNATPDFSHIVLQSNYGVPLTETPGDNGSSYVWSAGKLTWVGGYVAAGAGRPLSNDGSRVIGTGLLGHEGLDLREMSTGEVVQMDTGTPGYESYWMANDEASRVFFSAGRDLYVFEVTSGKTQPLAGKAIDLTVDKNPRESASVGGVSGASEDGSTVYFLAGGVLSSAANDEGERATPGGSNLYVERYEEASKAWGSPVFIATLSGEDGPSTGGHGTERVSPTAATSPSCRTAA